MGDKTLGEIPLYSKKLPELSASDLELKVERNCFNLRDLTEKESNKLKWGAILGVFGGLVGAWVGYMAWHSAVRRPLVDQITFIALLDKSLNPYDKLHVLYFAQGEGNPEFAFLYYVMCKTK